MGTTTEAETVTLTLERVKDLLYTLESVNLNHTRMDVRRAHDCAERLRSDLKRAGVM